MVHQLDLMTKFVICEKCHNERLEKLRAKYGDIFDLIYLVKKPYMRTVHIRKSVNVDNSKRQKWIKIGYYCEKCDSFLSLKDLVKRDSTKHNKKIKN